MSGLEWFALLAAIVILAIINGFVWLHLLQEILFELG